MVDNRLIKAKTLTSFTEPSKAEQSRIQTLTMSPHLINTMLNHSWFVSTQMKEIRRFAVVLQTTNALQVLNCIENAAAKFIRTISHRQHRTIVRIIVYCLVLSMNCTKYVNCDIEPHPVHPFSDNDDAINAIAGHAPVNISYFILF